MTKINAFDYLGMIHADVLACLVFFFFLSVFLEMNV